MTTQSNKIELKPCPFCQENPELSAFKSFAFGDQWQIDCKTPTCIEVSTGCRNSEQEAIKLWNTRALESQDRKVILAENLTDEQLESIKAAKVPEPMGSIADALDGLEAQSDGDIRATTMEMLTVGKDQWGEDLIVMGKPNAIAALKTKHPRAAASVPDDALEEAFRVRDAMSQRMTDPKDIIASYNFVDEHGVSPQQYIDQRARLSAPIPAAQEVDVEALKREIGKGFYGPEYYEGISDAVDHLVAAGHLKAQGDSIEDQDHIKVYPGHPLFKQLLTGYNTTVKQPDVGALVEEKFAEDWKGRSWWGASATDKDRAKYWFKKGVEAALSQWEGK